MRADEETEQEARLPYNVGDNVFLPGILFERGYRAASVSCISPPLTLACSYRCITPSHFMKCVMPDGP